MMHALLYTSTVETLCNKIFTKETLSIRKTLTSANTIDTLKCYKRYCRYTLHQPVSIHSLSWCLIVPNGAEIMIMAVVDKCCLRIIQAFLERSQSFVASKANCPRLSTWFVEVICPASYPVIFAQLLKPSSTTKMESLVLILNLQFLQI